MIMKIVVIDKFSEKVIYLDVEKEMIKSNVHDFLQKHGINTMACEWFIGDGRLSFVPIEYHRYVIHKNDGKEVHETCTERLRFGSPYYRVKDLKRREAEECAAVLRKYGDGEDGGFEHHFEADKPVVAGYLYDEPCDIVVNVVRVKDGEITILGYDKNDPTTEQEISADELFAGQLSEITERI